MLGRIVVRLSKGVDVRSNVERHIHFIHLYSTADPQQTKALTDTISRGQLLTVCEIVLNIKAGNLEKPPLFDKHKDLLETLADTKVALNLKRDILHKSAVYRGVIKRIFKHFLTCVKNI
jgi:hypothetical protein